MIDIDFDPGNREPAEGPIDRGVSAAFDFWERVDGDPNRMRMIDGGDNFSKCSDEVARAMASPLLAGEMTDDGSIATIVRATRFITTPSAAAGRRRAFNDTLTHLAANPDTSLEELHDAGVFRGEDLSHARQSIFELASLVTHRPPTAS